MKPTKEESIRTLANIHFEIEEGMERIFRLCGPNEDAEREPIKLLEVNRETVATGIMPLRFAAIPERGIAYTTVLVEITPAEFAALQAGQLTLPNQWVIGEELPPEPATLPA